MTQQSKIDNFNNIFLQIYESTICMKIKANEKNNNVQTTLVLISLVSRGIATL